MKEKHFKTKNTPSKFSYRNSSSNTFWIILISVLFFLFLVFSKWNKIEDFFGFSVNKPVATEEFVLWEEISVEGIITQDWDFITHTHKLSTLSSGVFWLKSRNINLNQYSGTVLLEGFVDNKNQWLYILDVTKVMAQFDDVWIEDNSNLWNNLWQYFSNAWIYFKPDFFENYTIVSTWKSEIQVKSILSDSLITIDYFLCNKSDPNRDCKKLSTTFDDSSEKRFNTDNWMTFYKLSEISSWFFTNQELFGYFINDVSEQEVTNLSSYIVFPTSEYVKDFLEPKVSVLCKEWNIFMNDIKKSTLFLDKWNLAVNFVGNRDDWTAECIIEIDPSLSALWILKKFTYNEDTLTWVVEPELEKIEIEKEPEVVENIPLKPSSNQSVSNVLQYPLTLDKKLVFKSSRGHSISFPSSKISYKSDSVSENLGLAWVNCYVATKVIEYAKKDLIDSEPTVIIYECRIKENIDIPYEYYTKPVSDWRTFVVSVINPAWHDFANNIEVTINE